MVYVVYCMCWELDSEEGHKKARSHSIPAELKEGLGEGRTCTMGWYHTLIAFSACLTV